MIPLHMIRRRGLVALGSGRSRISGFVTAGSHAVLIECTEFVKADDVDATPGWLDGRS